ncbi:MAG: lysophospholipid acyltransferase family protein [Paramuribaculum sp.]|nr:lysophospholipid acyltransferase family protein [Paramuribaculum sp.]
MTIIKRLGNWGAEIFVNIQKLLSYLPFWILYGIADMIFVLMYHVARYRRRVVADNIARCFPDKPEKERNSIVRQFYRNFADSFVETIKLHHVSDEQIRKRIIFENTEIVDNLLDEGRSVVCYFSHCFNWEWGTSITLWTKHKPNTDTVYSQVYRPLNSKPIDRLYLHLRSRFGSESFAKSHVLRDLIRTSRNGKMNVCGFMSDQKPSHGDPTHIMRFLGQPTAMITGTETLARKLKMSVAYMDMYKLSRGHYKVRMRMIAERPEELPSMELTERYAMLLEQTIQRNPAIWLWSHKRWKYPVTLPPDYDLTHPQK